ncbi:MULTISPECIES: cysteine/serine endopeptidase inhibitor [Kitasatospora]|uniref:Fibronectin type-III domain-containing protein n=1 Tax=Kitasatospora arboriphila TaxID=258052 RepID=A0ABP4E000_9ACTN
MHSAPKRIRRRWIAALVGALMLTVFGIGSALASIPVGESRTGKMTWYDDAGYGACGTAINAAAEDLVAVSTSWWTSANPNNDDLCKGISVQVSYQGRTITVPVRDKCPSCSAEHIDLSKTAFQKLADLNVGVVSGITWKFVGSGGGSNGGSGGGTGGGTGGGGTTTLPAPTGLRATATTASSVSLAWTAVQGASSYAVYRGGTKVGTASGASYSDTGLSAATGYRYTVAAVDSAGKAGAQSAAVTATTTATGGGGGGTACPAAWSASRSYVPGDAVGYAGHKYSAIYYSTGAVPNDPGSWAVWRDSGTC